MGKTVDEGKRNGKGRVGGRRGVGRDGEEEEEGWRGRGPDGEGRA